MKWFVILLGFTVVGCGSGSKIRAEQPQYCYTQQVIVKDDNNEISSRTVVECDDNRVRRLFQVQSGMAPNCGEFTYWMQIGGRNVQRKGVSCQKPDGSWEIVNTGRN